MMVLTFSKKLPGTSIKGTSEPEGSYCFLSKLRNSININCPFSKHLGFHLS